MFCDDTREIWYLFLLFEALVRVTPGERPVAEKAKPSKVVDSKGEMASVGGFDVMIQKFGMLESRVGSWLA